MWILYQQQTVPGCEYHSASRSHTVSAFNIDSWPFLEGVYKINLRFQILRRKFAVPSDFIFFNDILYLWRISFVALINAFGTYIQRVFGVQFLNLVFHNFGYLWFSGCKWWFTWFSTILATLPPFFSFGSNRSTRTRSTISHCVFRVFDCHFRLVVYRSICI